MRYIAFLRGINVSGQKLIKMEELRKYFETPEFQNVVTYIQSGNILFDSTEKSEAALRERVENVLKERLGYAVPTIVRSLNNIKKVIKNNPLSLPPDDPRKLHVTFLADKPRAGVLDMLTPFKGEQEDIAIADREIYLLTVSYGNSKLSNTLVEKKLGMQATTRNWATVNKVLEL